MFSEYEEYYTEPSEVDLIIEEAKEKLNDLLTDNVKNAMEKASAAQKRLEELEREIQNKAWELKGLKEKVTSMEEKVELAETRDIPRKYIAKFVKDATGDFVPGDKVWYLQYKGITEDCPDCHRKRKVIANVLGKNTEVACPTCDGYGYLRKTSYEIVPKVVESVQLKLCFREDRVSYWSRECVYLKGRDSHTNIKHIFKTKEEAEQALAEMKEGEKENEMQRL